MGKRRSVFEKARILNAIGEPTQAARALQQLLTMRSSDGRAARQLLELAGLVPEVKAWLRFQDRALGQDVLEAIGLTAAELRLRCRNNITRKDISGVTGAPSCSF